MRGVGGLTEALNSLFGSTGVVLPPWAFPAIMMMGFLWLLPHIRQNQRTHNARKMIQERTVHGGIQSDGVHQEILNIANGHPITLVVIADEAHRRGILALSRKALSALEQSGKRVADIRRLRTLLNGPAPVFVDGEIEAIESLLSKGLTGLARNRLKRAQRHWPNNPAWGKWDTKISAEE
jgi:hypothetical protein